MLEIALGQQIMDGEGSRQQPQPVKLLAGPADLASLLIALLVKPIIAWRARRARRRAESRLRAAVGEVGRQHVVAPVHEVLNSYGQAREALGAAVPTR